mmetsp:Transcript_64089/g.126770  ORF Transcript_64089/g.126770 Transcript_64089/m.126770 type:complete len:323 (-) Transcript_64089:135-1103(-)
MAWSFQLLFAFLALFAPAASAAADSGCAETNGDKCRAGDETAFVQVDSGKVSRAQELALMNEDNDEENWPGMRDAFGNLIKVLASGMVNPSNCEKAVNMTRPLLFEIDKGLKACSDQLDAYADETLKRQDVYLEQLHNTSGTVSNYLEKFGELVNASLDAGGKGKHMVGKLLMPLVMKSMSGLDKAGYADVADLLNDTLFEDGITWILKKSSSKVEKARTITDAEATLLINEVNTTLEATLSRFDALSKVVSLSLDGVTGGVTTLLAGRFPEECKSIVLDPIALVNATKDEVVAKMDTIVDKMVNNVRDGMSTVAAVLTTAV